MIRLAMQWLRTRSRNCRARYVAGVEDMQDNVVTADRRQTEDRVPTRQQIDDHWRAVDLAVEALSQLHDPNDPRPEVLLQYVINAMDKAWVAEFVAELAQQEATRLRQIAERQIEVAKAHPVVDCLRYHWVAEFLGAQPVARRPLSDARVAVRIAERAGPYAAELISKELARLQADLDVVMHIDLVKREGREPMPVVVAAVDAMKGVDLADLDRKLCGLAELFGHVRKPARS